MKLTLRQLQIFSEIAKAGSTTAASRQLHLSQSATSAGLIELERTLDIELFDRHNKKLVLNQRGHKLLERIGSVLDEVQNIERDFCGAAPQAGMALKIGVSAIGASYVLPGIVAKFHQAHPRQEIAINGAETDAVCAAVANFSCDIGFISRSVQLANLSMIQWFREEFVIVASPRYRLQVARSGDPVSVAALGAAEWLLLGCDSGMREIVETLIAPGMQRLRIGATLNDMDAIKLAVMEGMGLACLPYRCVKDLIAVGALLDIGFSHAALFQPQFIVTHPGRQSELRVRQFVALCQQWSSSASTGARRHREASGNPLPPTLRVINFGDARAPVIRARQDAHVRPLEWEQGR